MKPIQNMKRRTLLNLLSIAGLSSLLPGAAFSKTPPKVSRTPQEWKALVGDLAYAVLFEHATERAGTSIILTEKRAGTYLCAACKSPLFKSEAKYDSGTGWPSFNQALDGALGTETDYKLIVPRTEYHCEHCGGHQGHVFKDGPRPTGLRFCNNGVALEFIELGKPLPKVLS